MRYLIFQHNKMSDWSDWSDDGLLEYQASSEVHNEANNKSQEPNQDIRDSLLPSQETGICDISQECVADDNLEDKRDNQNEPDSESHNISSHIVNEPNQDIRYSPLPSQETGICDISQDRVDDDNCKDKRENQNEQDSESHSIAIHIANEPNQYCQYNTNEIQMPNHDGSVMAQNQGEVPHNNIKENCTSISEHSSTVDQIQHQSHDNPNVSNANKLHGGSSESIMATSIPLDGIYPSVLR